MRPEKYEIDQYLQFLSGDLIVSSVNKIVNHMQGIIYNNNTR